MDVLTISPITERICSYCTFEEAVLFLSVLRISECNCSITVQDRFDKKTIILPGINPTTIAIYRLIRRGGTQEAFQLAASRGNTEMVKILLKIDQEFYGSTPYLKESAIIWAATNGHTDIIQTLVSSKASVFYNDLWDNTPLMVAARNGHEQTVKYLIEQKVNVNAFDCWKTSALSIATEANNFSMVQLLVSAKADIHQPIWGNRTVLSLAKDSEDSNILKYLQKHS